MQRWPAWNSRRTLDFLHTLSASTPCTLGKRVHYGARLDHFLFRFEDLFLFDVQEYFYLHVRMSTA